MRKAQEEQHEDSDIYHSKGFSVSHIKWKNSKLECSLTKSGKDFK